jgi:cation diffusion facilitator CzcD-associated flavoprotein CzcO
VTVAIDTGFSGFVRTGLVEVVAEIDRFTADEVILADGVRLQPDVVLVATGYRSGLEPQVGHLGVLRADGRPRVAADGVSSEPGLWFIGFTPAIEGMLRLHRVEARRIAHAIARERHHALTPGPAAAGTNRTG